VGLPPTRAGELRELFGIDIPASVADDTLLQVHPTQLYETAMALAIWGVGLWLFKRRLPAGMTGLVVLGLLAVERFLIEFLRAKDDRFFGGFTLAQMISLGVLLVIAVLLWMRRRRLALSPA
jgi:phosphatidylglycerol:prolipoprotein diacylglycerol transferase